MMRYGREIDPEPPEPPTDAVAGNVQIDSTITGNEYEAKILWLKILNVLERHDEKYGEGHEE